MAKIHIDPIKNKKMYLQIVEKFLNMVSENQIEYGDKLFSESELMQMFNVSRPTLREALRVLEFLGMVTIGTRSGIRINAPEDTLNYAPLLYIMIFEKPTNMDLFEIRRALQVEMVGLAAIRRTEDDCRVLREIVRKTEESLNSDYIEFAKLDYDFHFAIIEFTRNILGMKLMETMAAFMKQQLQRIILELGIENRISTIKYHKEICRAVSEQKAHDARAIMQEHLEIPYRSLKQEPIKFVL